MDFMVSFSYYKTWRSNYVRSYIFTLIDEEKVKLLAYLVRETNSEIILHSGWRFWFDSELKPLCKEADKLVELLEKEDLHIKE